MLRFRPTTRGGLVGFVFFLSVVATTALGGCGDDASSPLEEGEQERGLEEVAQRAPAQSREEPKPPSLFGKVHVALASRLSISRIIATSMSVSLVCTLRS